MTSLTSQLAQLSDSLKATNALTTRLSKLSFQPGSEPLSNSSSVRIELAQDIHDSLKQLEEDLELLKQEAEDPQHSSRRRDSVRDGEKVRIQAQIARLDEDLRHSRSTFRKAQLQAKKASEQAKQKERELVFASLQNPTQPLSSSSNDTDLPPNRPGQRQLGQSQLTKEELETDASSSVTSALRRTHDLLSTELSRSRFAQETFDQSTAALADLADTHYTNLDNILGRSRDLLGTLVRSQKSDTWYLETAFYLLIATLVWLIFRRLLLGPFVRLPLFVWNIVVFCGRWVLWIGWKTVLLVATLTGVLKPDPSAVRSSSLARSRTPLIVQPSAKGGIPKMAMPPNGGSGIPAGAGGARAKVGTRDQGQMTMSETIGRMAEESATGDRISEGDGGDGGNDEEGEEKVARRADGTVLQERGDVPPNPKKRMFEAGVEDKKYDEQRKRDEL